MKRWSRLRFVAYGGILAALAVWEGSSQSREEAPEASRQVLRAPASTWSPRSHSWTRSEHRQQMAPAAAPTAAHFGVPGVEVQTLDSIAALYKQVSLTPPQNAAVRDSVALKKRDLQELQQEVYANRLDREEVSFRAKVIQASFEAKICSILRPGQLEQYYRLKDAGKIGTYALIIPRQSYSE